MTEAVDRFVHLHLHTEYSLLDGACRIKPLIQRVNEMGQAAVAITDHGVMYGAVDFYKEAKAYGVRPIIGCEVYVSPRSRFDKTHQADTSPYHLVLLCKNQTGYQNLIKLVSRGFTEGFYYKPRIDRELLDNHSEGLIALSACLSGEVPRALLKGDYKKAREAACYYRDLFGEDNYFIELQNHGIPEMQDILPDLVKLSREIGVGLVATNDSHYIRKEDSSVQNILVCIQTNRTIHDKNNLEFATEEFYVKTRKEMEETLRDWIPKEALKESLDNTCKIAARCEVEFAFGNHVLPLYQAPNGEDNVEFFCKMCYEGLKKHYGNNPTKEVQERLEYELAVIEKMGYIDYFLIVYDFVNYAKQNGIPVGPGRGSGAGSIAAYCIGITGVDPIQYNLLFERFLNPERVSMPDFDIDFCYERREEVIQYVIKKYSKERVSQIITFGTMAARGAIRDVGRVLAMSYQQVDVVAKAIPNELHVTIQRALEKSSDLKAMYDNDMDVRKLIDVASQLEGIPRHASTHAAGVVIARDAVENYVPLAKNDESIVTQFTMTTLEELGLLKIDFLGLRNLTVINDSEKMIKCSQADFSMENIHMNDLLTFEMMSKGQAKGVFQFESGGMRQVLIQLKPESVEDLIAVISLYRPGPMDSIPKYIRNRHNPQLVSYQTPLLKNILDVTYGCIVYQEQVMQIFRELAGYSYGRADLVRRAMSKKKHDVMEQERHNFIYGAKKPDGTTECVGCMAHGISEKIATEIFDEMSSFASYAFNKSHAAAYAIVAYQTAFLKAHYPREYMAALLTSVLDNTDKIIGYIAECDAMKIKILPPDVNKSRSGFTVEEVGIRFGLQAVKNVGKGVMDAVVKERDAHGEFTGLSDLCERIYSCDLNRRAMESLIQCGALDCFGYNRRTLLTGIGAMITDIDDRHKNNIEGQMNLFDAPDSVKQEYKLAIVDDYSADIRLSMEKEVTGLFVSGHPLTQYKEMSQQLQVANLGDIVSGDILLSDGDNVKLLSIVSSKKVKATKSGGTMAFVNIEDTTGALEMLVFPKVYDAYRHLIEENQVLYMEGRISIREEEDPKIICISVLKPDQIKNISKEETVSQKPKEMSVAEIGKKGGRPGLYLRIPSNSSYEFEKIKQYLTIFEGKEPVYFRFMDTGKLLVAPGKLWVDFNIPLYKQLVILLGSENVARVLSK